MSDFFLYFAYGSNLLKKRIHINNPTAKFIDIGRLDGHRLDFITHSPNWNGAASTIVKSDRSSDCVWGAMWKISMADLEALDKQEGVDTNWYFPKQVTIVKPDGNQVECRVYEQFNTPEYSEVLPLERQPSLTYLDVVVRGAEECGLPEEYIEKLKQIPHNGKEASPELLEKLKNL